MAESEPEEVELAEAAAVPTEETEEPEPEPASKKAKTAPAPFMKKVTGLQTRLAQQREALEKNEDALGKLISKGFGKPLSKRDREAKETKEKKVAALTAQIAATETELAAAEEEAHAKAEAAAAKEALKKESDEANRPMSDMGRIKLVELVEGKYRRRFENNSDTHARIWEHIQKDFQKLVEDGELPETDARSADALRSR
jgi:hypothetical protein